MNENNSSFMTIVFGQNFSITQIILFTAGILTIFTILYKSVQSCIPKEIKHQTNFKYVDFQTGVLIEEKQYEFFWGRFGFKKYKFPNFPLKSKIEILYKPILGMEDIVPGDRCIITKKDTYCSIEFIDTMFFKNAETEYIKIHANTEIENMNTYKDKISVASQDKTIIVLNRNDIEIRNFPVKIPSDLDILEKRLDLLKYGSLTTPDHYTGVENMVLLIHLPKGDNDNPGRKIIDFN